MSYLGSSSERKLIVIKPSVLSFLKYPCCYPESQIYTLSGSLLLEDRLNIAVIQFYEKVSLTYSTIFWNGLILVHL
jgi:hypothetical protein